MEKYKNYLIVFLIILIVIGGLFGGRYLGSPKDIDQIAAYRDTLTLYKYQKEVIDKKVVELTANDNLLLESVDSVHNAQVATKIVYKNKLVYTNLFTAVQVDSAFAAAYPIAPPKADTGVSCQPVWRVKAAEIDLVLGQQAIVLNTELHTEIVIKDKLLDNDQLVIDELKAKDSISTKQLAAVVAENAVETKVLKKQIRRQKWKTIKVIAGAAVIWTLTILALK